jgi:mannose-6-phosphate isomerase-like protein (cupin superfamily)
MNIIKLNDCKEFIAGDKTILREMLHASKGNYSIGYSLAHASLKPGNSSTTHALKTSEVYFIIEGKGEMHIDNEVKVVEVNDTVYIPPNAKQFIKNIGETDLKFICIVDPAWKIEDEIIF